MICEYSFWKILNSKFLMIKTKFFLSKSINCILWKWMPERNRTAGPPIISVIRSLKLGGGAKCFKSMNEIKSHRKSIAVLKFLENIEGAVAPLPPSKLHLCVLQSIMNWKFCLFRTICFDSSLFKSFCSSFVY